MKYDVYLYDKDNLIKPLLVGVFDCGSSGDALKSAEVKIKVMLGKMQTKKYYLKAEAHNALHRD